MNLSTAKSERRAREVGIRKTFGSGRYRLVFQFIGEAILTSFIAMLLALALLILVLPIFNVLLERDLSLMLIGRVYTIPLLLGFVLLIGLMAGSYPAFYLSAFTPSKVLKGGEGSESRKSLLRSSLVIVQFAISICLLIGTLVIKKQLDFIQSKNLGFNKEHLLAISNANLLGEHRDAFKEELLENPKVLSVTNTTRMFTTGVPGNGYLFDKKAGTDPFLCQMVLADYDFLKTFQIELKEGRFFSEDFPSDKDAVVVNEAAVALFPTDDPIGKELVSLDARERGHGYKIIGVISDFNYESLHTRVRPLVLHLETPNQFANVLTIRVASDEMMSTLGYITDKWKQFIPGDPLNYNFVDENLARLYVAEEKTNVVSIIFSSIAIFIACIGLFGLAAFVTEQRTKEIGIRKVLGATSAQVVLLVSREFAFWVLISNILAWPVAWYVMKGWLNNFAFRTEISIGYFALAGAVTFLIAILTVGFHALRAAEANPVQSLKHE
jgi:putative ABC transport system permease protein